MTLVKSGRSRQAITLCAAPLTTLAATMTRLRGRRSAQTPPTRMKTICGAQPAASTKPRSEAEPRSSTAKARAMGAIAVPASEMSCPAKRSRNCRSPSGLRLLLRSITRMNLSPAARLCRAAHYAPGEAPNLSTTQLGTRAKRACPVSPQSAQHFARNGLRPVRGAFPAVPTLRLDQRADLRADFFFNEAPPTEIYTLFVHDAAR